MRFRVIDYDGSDHEIDEDNIVTVRSFGFDNDMNEVLLDDGNRIFINPNENKDLIEWAF